MSVSGCSSVTTEILNLKKMYLILSWKEKNINPAESIVKSCKWFFLESNNLKNSYKGT